MKKKGLVVALLVTLSAVAFLSQSEPPANVIASKLPFSVGCR